MYTGCFTKRFNGTTLKYILHGFRDEFSLCMCINIKYLQNVFIRLKYVPRINNEHNIVMMDFKERRFIVPLFMSLLIFVMNN